MAFAVRARSEQGKQWTLRRLDRRAEVVAAIQQQRRHQDPRRIVHGIDSDAATSGTPVPCSTQVFSRGSSAARVTPALAPALTP